MRPPTVAPGLPITVLTSAGAPLAKARVWLQQPQFSHAELAITDAAGRAVLGYKPGAPLLGLPNPAFPMTLGVTAYTGPNALQTVGNGAAVVITLPAGFVPLLERDPTASPGNTAVGVAITALLGKETAVASASGLKEPGCICFVRKNGVPFVDACLGLARVLTPTVAETAMNPDTIIHIGSMSKPFATTALAAMKDDWAEIAELVRQVKAGQVVPASVYTLPATPRQPARTFSFPDVLAPLLTDPVFAQAILGKGALAGFPLAIAGDVRAVAASPAGALAPAPVCAPWQAGLLRQVLGGVTGIDYDQKFLPFFKDILDVDGDVGNGVADITIRQLITHNTYFDGPHVNLHDTLEWSMMQGSQLHLVGMPGPGRPTPVATLNRLAEVKGLLKEGGGPRTIAKYSNYNYSVLGALIQVCTGMDLNDYQNARLFFDSRFDRIRRHVVDPDAGCLYYNGDTQTWHDGVTLCDFSQWSGAGGFFAPASQITDWLHAIASELSVNQWGGKNGPLVSTAGWIALVIGDSLFSEGSRVDHSHGVSGLEHNGWFRFYTSDASFGVYGRMGIFLGPGASFHTAFVCGNSGHETDTAFAAVIDQLVSSTFWS